MRKRRLRGGITALSVLAAIGMASGITAFAADDTQSEAVDTGKGLEYVYESSGSTPSGVTLNGNSVIIKQSPNSTDSEQLFNIYNDKDRDGILDEGEEAFTLDGSTDIQYGNIYGIYHGKGSSPISITIDGAELPAVYGAFESTVETPENMTAVTISVKGDAAVESLYGLFRTYCTGGVLIDTEESVTIKSLYGLRSSTMDGDITENINYNCDGNTFVTLATDGYYTGKAYTINGDESIDLHTALDDVINNVSDMDIYMDYDMSDKLPREIKYSFINIVKEAINNTLKHSNGDHMDIRVREHPAFYQLYITDNGQNIRSGPSPAQGSASGGMGLNGIQERVNKLGGTMKISTDDGFSILINIMKRDFTD